MQTELELRKKIMRRVYGVYVMRQVMKPSSRFAILTLTLLAIASSVSMPNVIANALHTNDLFTFTLAAISGTKLYVQLGILLAGFVVIWTAIDAIRPRSH